MMTFIAIVIFMILAVPYIGFYFIREGTKRNDQSAVNIGAVLLIGGIILYAWAFNCCICSSVGGKL